jgi:hypothetical protein
MYQCTPSGGECASVQPAGEWECIDLSNGQDPQNYSYCLP